MRRSLCPEPAPSEARSSSGIAAASSPEEKAAPASGAAMSRCRSDPHNDVVENAVQPNEAILPLRHKFGGPGHSGRVMADPSEEEVRAWLFTVARRQLSRYLRRARVERRAVQRLGIRVPPCTRTMSRRSRSALGLPICERRWGLSVDARVATIRTLVLSTHPIFGAMSKSTRNTGKPGTACGQARRVAQAHRSVADRPPVDSSPRICGA
jgi:hypothetical protein